MGTAKLMQAMRHSLHAGVYYYCHLHRGRNVYLLLNSKGLNHRLLHILRTVIVWLLRTVLVWLSTCIPYQLNIFQTTQKRNLG